MHPNKILELFLIFYFNSRVKVVSCEQICDPLNFQKNQSNMCILNQNLNEKKSDYAEGDYTEIFQFDKTKKQAYALISLRSQESLVHGGGKNESCYVCISYYNVSSGEFEIQDKLWLNSEEPTSSSNSIWEGKRDSKSSKDANLNIYDIGSKSGTIYSFFSK